MFPDWLQPDGPGNAGGGSFSDHDAGADHVDDDPIGSVAGRTADDWLAGKTAEALRMDPLVCGPCLEVVVQNRVVILLGELVSTEATEAAGRCVWAISGVRDVCNRLTVAEPRAYGS